ncbi:uncharacterized protein LOC108156423 [Drosophila miranda]|uniref:uncharacterized protein LOC108156423 n=1 Tax=Drosophila miranda TaxID=7229 RepID=UPI0007E606D9|nr:uncharacterized protein LOC108156423 [Drosophila miranda]
MKEDPGRSERCSSRDRDPQGLQTLRYIQKHLGPEVDSELACMEAGWYRNLSKPQMNAALAMSDALRDDMEQWTTRRTWRLVEVMGLRPRPSKKTLIKLMRMSRGNNLAFLWFLMEMCYKTEAHGRAYDVNEQIIMSAIFWLDLYPTLQELDRVLPLPNDTQTDMANVNAEPLQKQSQRLDDRRSETEKRNPKKMDLTRPLSPYFQEPSAFRPWRPTMNIMSEVPARPAMLGETPREAGESPLLSRWFGHYVFSDAHRISRSILYEEIRNIIASFDAAELPAHDVEALCTHHQRIREMEKSLKVQLEALKKQQCEELLTAPNRLQQRRRKQVISELEQMVACCQAQFHEMATRTRQASTRKQLFSCACDGAPMNANILCLRKPSGSGGGDGDGDGDGSSHVRLLQGVKPVIPHCSRGFKLEPMDCASCEMYDPENGLPVPCTGKRLGRPSSLMQFLKLGDEDEKLSSDGDKENAPSAPSPPQSQSCSDSMKVFEVGTQKAADFKFNYRRLFGPSKATRLDDQNLRLKAAFLKALDEDCEFLNAALNREEDDSVSNLVDRAAKRVFAKDTEIFNEEYERLVHRKSELKKERRLNFGQQYYDPEDILLMKRMLKKGLDTVGKDHRYVLPTLPNVHSVPYLLEWICSRYGKRYTPAERKRSYLHNNFHMTLLYELMKYPLVKPPSLPNARRQRPSKNFSKHLREHQTNLFVEALMSVGRVFFSAMRSPLCDAPPGEIFYAYMPAAYRDTGFSINKTLRTRRK